MLNIVFYDLYCLTIIFNRCDKTATIFFQGLAIYKNENLLNRQKWSKKAEFYCHILNEPAKNCQRIFKVLPKW